MLHLIIELRYISAKIRKFTDVCMVGDGGGNKLAMSKVEKKNQVEMSISSITEQNTFTKSAD